VPLALFPLRWARWFLWKVPAETDLAVYFGRCVGVLALAIIIVAFRAVPHPERFPVEVNRAAYDELLRVPGIGPISGKRIIALRAAHTVRELRDLSRLGVAVKDLSSEERKDLGLGNDPGVLVTGAPTAARGRQRHPARRPHPRRHT
jgi:hypothetical protein